MEPSSVEVAEVAAVVARRRGRRWRRGGDVRGRVLDGGWDGHCMSHVESQIKVTGVAGSLHWNRNQQLPPLLGTISPWWPRRRDGLQLATSCLPQLPLGIPAGMFAIVTT